MNARPRDGLLRALAPAKINRELRVGGRRPDGFHELLSRFASIDLCDELEVEPSDGLDFSITGRPVPAGKDNLVLRAARALSEATGVLPRAKIRLHKRIPVGAGLGGGSSDAAAALRLLRALWAPDLPEAHLRAIAPALGSDVPYFFTGGEADVSGRGEHVEARPDEPLAELLLLIPPFALSTAEVFAEHARQTSGRSRIPEHLEIETSGKFFGPNQLASPVLATQGAMKAYLKSAADAASEAAITGSGSTIVLFGAGAGAETQLEKQHPEASLLRTRTLGRREYEERTRPAGGAQWRSPR
ncbi:MAG: 4-(cytidine 5'-diphospho)-2-C-methyl-D-erythritol kinase [Acidobacteria bacterium]|nr:4-(cytidine 5'-diphospho)-2-C-methyl-D-erythritol kinase [Acidobacteriota bacterium]MCA1610620.1 4-(cytidine 5'-diphospho)-2-C-methyl-D-erythritol kinase [Acidobacteriota bacterium]